MIDTSRMNINVAVYDTGANHETSVVRDVMLGMA